MISLSDGHRFYIKQEHAHTRYTTPLPSCPEPVTYRHIPCPNACVSAYRTVTQPSDSKALGAGQGQLDTDWTESGRGWQRIRGRGGPWGDPGAAVHAYGLHKFMLKFMVASVSLRRGPPKGRRCYVTYGGSEGSSWTAQGAVRRISSKKSLPDSE